METIVNYISIGLGLILALIGIILQIRSNKKKDIVFSIKSNNLISNSSPTLENLTVLYKDQKIENLTASRVLFYNRGAETITQQDLMTINHFSVKSGEKILDASILRTNYLPNNIRLQHENGSNEVLIDFDYLDQNQGAIIQIIHTGVTSESLVVQGSIMGVKNLTKIVPEQLIKPLRPLNAPAKKILFLSVIVGLLGYYAIFVQRTYFDILRTSNFLLVWLIGVLFSGIVFIAWGIPMLLVIEFIRQFLNSGKVIPDDLDQFEE